MILEFKDVRKEDTSVAGGKGANLGELTVAGFRVPKGFVITAETYLLFLRENGIDRVIEKELSDAGTDDRRLLWAASIIQGRIKQGIFPNEVKTRIVACYETVGAGGSVAVRSSATAEDLPDASFAGQQETYLNVSGADELLDRVRSCYASLWSSRAVSYRKNQGYGQENIAIAVVVQEMVKSDKSGVLFTVNPVSNKASEMQINANYGLGESVVSGRVTADSYLVDRKGNILDIVIGTKETQIVYGIKETKEAMVDAEKRAARVLGDEELADLVKLGLAVEAHYGNPMDIEWTIRDGELYVLQARAITTLKKMPEDKEIQCYIENIKIKKSNRELMSFLIEKIPFAYRALEYDYFLIEVEQKAEIFSENGVILTPQLSMDLEGIMTIQNEKKYLNFNIFKLFGTLKRLRDFDYCAKYCRAFIKEYGKKVDELKEIAFDNMELSDCKEFMNYSYDLIKQIAYKRFKYALFPSLLNKNLTRALKKINSKYTSFDLYWGLDNRTSVVEKEIKEMGIAIKNNKDMKEAILSGNKYDELCRNFSEFKELAEKFLNNNGFKSDYNAYCVEGKTFIEDPDRIIKILQPIVGEDDNSNNEMEHKDFREITEALKTIYGKDYSKLENKIENFRYFHFVREEGQYYIEMIYFYIRKCIKRINMLLLNSEDYKSGISNLFYLELIQVLNQGGLTDEDIKKIRIRNKKFPLAQAVWNASKLLIYETKGDVLTGVSGNAGIAVGKVCVIKNSKEFYKMKKGSILVCPFTTPEWTPLFHLASAVVADTGSALSHAAIVAREFGIPAVLGAGFATTRLKNGSMVRVDGGKGEVSLC